MGKLSTPVVAVLAAVLTAAASAQTRPQAGSGGEEGFFRPSRDPALTAIRPPPAPAEAKPAAVQPAQAAAVDVAEAIREAEEQQMDRMEGEHAAALAAQPEKGPAMTSPLDGTAPILSPLDGTAPILSPLDGTAPILSPVSR